MAKLERTQRILGTRTETETIHRALDLVAEEAALVLALRAFVLKGGGHIEDVDARGSSVEPAQAAAPTVYGPVVHPLTIEHRRRQFVFDRDTPVADLIPVDDWRTDESQGDDAAQRPAVSARPGA